QPARELTMDGQIRIAADGRGEMSVILAGQRVMAFFLWAILGLFEASEEGIMHGVRLGLVGRLLENALERKPIHFLPRLVAEKARERGECSELRRVGGRMDAAQKRGAEAFDFRRHGFVGGEHELLDDLMAHVVLYEVAAGHAAVVVVFELYLRHVEL